MPSIVRCLHNPLHLRISSQSASANRSPLSFLPTILQNRYPAQMLRSDAFEEGQQVPPSKPAQIVHVVLLSIQGVFDRTGRAIIRKRHDPIHLSGHPVPSIGASTRTETVRPCRGALHFSAGWIVLDCRDPYADLGVDYFDRRGQSRQTRSDPTFSRSRLSRDAGSDPIVIP